MKKIIISVIVLISLQIAQAQEKLQINLNPNSAHLGSLFLIF